MHTTIAQKLQTAGLKAAYDAACKKILSEKVILAWILQQCLWEYQSCTIEEIAERYIEGTAQIDQVMVGVDEGMPTAIQGISTEDTTIQEGTVSYDIRFLATLPDSKEQVHLIINVEVQNDFYPGYPLVKRGIYYGGRMLSAQYGTEFTGSHYEKLKKVYSIWVCMNPPKHRMNKVIQYRIQEEDVDGEAVEKRENYDLMTVIMLCVGEETLEGSPSESGEVQNRKQILRLLGVLLSSQMDYQKKQEILQEEFQVRMTETMEREVESMCNLSDGVYNRGIENGIRMGIERGMERGIAQGMEQGIAQGMEQGIAQGIEERNLYGIRNMMKLLQLPMEEAMVVMGISEEKKAYYTSLLLQDSEPSM